MGKKTITIDGVYTLKKKLGQGGMAAVFLAEVDLRHFDYTTLYAYTQVRGDSHAQRRRQAEQFAAELRERELDASTVHSILEASRIPLPGRQAALKIATSARADRRRFEGEWKNLLCLSHPNVVEVYGGGVYNGRPYYAMELLGGIASPGQVLENFSLRLKVQAVIDAAAGLGYLHGSGIVHRDVKPANLMICRAPHGGKGYVTKVGDLGIAKELYEEAAAVTMTSTVLGTAHYMAPEQVESSREADARADIYGLGAVLYYFLTGHKPYEDRDSVYEIIAAVSREEYPAAPQKHVPQLPEQMSSIISCAMSPHPQGRYRSMEELAADLRTYLAAEDDRVLECTGYSKADVSGAAASGGTYAYAGYSDFEPAVVSSSGGAAAGGSAAEAGGGGRRRLIVGGVAAAALAAAVFFAAVLPALRGPGAVEELLMRAEAAEQAGRYEQALSLLRDALSESGGDARIESLKADLTGRMRQVALLSSYESYREQGGEHETEGRLEESLASYGRALEAAQELEVEPASAESVRRRMAETGVALRHAREQAELLDEYEGLMHAARAAQSGGLWAEAKAAYGRAAAAGAWLDEEPAGFDVIYEEIERLRGQVAQAQAEAEAVKEEDVETAVVETGPRWGAQKGDGDGVAVSEDGMVVFLREDGRWGRLVPCAVTIESALTAPGHSLWTYPPTERELGGEPADGLEAEERRAVLERVREGAASAHRRDIVSSGRAAESLRRSAEEYGGPDPADKPSAAGEAVAVTGDGGVVVLREDGTWRREEGVVDEMEINRALNLRGHELWSHPRVVAELGGREAEGLSFEEARRVLRAALLVGLGGYGDAFERVAHAARMLSEPAAVEVADADAERAEDVRMERARPAPDLDEIMEFLEAMRWRRTYAGERGINCITYGGGVYVAVAGCGRIIASPDGERWREVAEFTEGHSFATGFYGAAYGNGMFVALGRSARIAASPDGLNWREAEKGTGGILHAATYGNGRFVAVGTSGRILTSADGLNWRSPADTGESNLRGLVYARGLFVAAGGRGTIMVSPDGMRWEQVDSGTGAGFRDVAYGNGRFVAVSSTGEIVVSPDGRRWRRAPGSFPGMTGVAYGRGVFLASVAGRAIMASVDGVTWQRVGTDHSVPRGSKVYFLNNRFIDIGEGIRMTQ